LRRDNLLFTGLSVDPHASWEVIKSHLATLFTDKLGESDIIIEQAHWLRNKLTIICKLLNFNVKQWILGKRKLLLALQLRVFVNEDYPPSI